MTMTMTMTIQKIFVSQPRSGTDQCCPPWLSRDAQNTFQLLDITEESQGQDDRKQENRNYISTVLSG